MTNPFDAGADPDRHDIWHRLIVADTEAFVAGDWSMIEGDFDAEQFEGIRCNHSTNPDDWTIAFPAPRGLPRLVADRLVAEFLARSNSATLTPARGRSTVAAGIDRIDLAGDRALAHKKFSGEVPLADGSTLSGSRQTLYRLHRIDGTWKIVGFLGQLPLDEPS